MNPAVWLYVDLSIWLNQFALHSYCLLGIVLFLGGAFQNPNPRICRIAVIDFRVCVCGLNKYPIIEQTFICHNEFWVHLCRLTRDGRTDVQLFIRFEILLEKVMCWIYGDTLLIWLVGVTILFLPFRQTETIYCNFASIIRLILISTEPNWCCAVNRFNAHTQLLIDRNEMISQASAEIESLWFWNSAIE